MQTTINSKQAIPIPQEVINTMGRLLFLAVIKHKEAKANEHEQEPDKKGA